MSESDTKKSRNRPKLGSVDAFWDDNPKCHLSKQIFDASIELVFFVLDIKAIKADDGKVCEGAAWNDTFETERIRHCINLMCFIHILHLCRLIFAVCTKYGSKKQGACHGCMRCLLIDCYCCAGTIVYLYVQVSWFLDLGDCKEELPEIKEHLRWEIVY